MLPLLCLTALFAQVSPNRIQNANQEPHNWLTYNGTYSSQHNSPLNKINRANVHRLRLAWVHQARSLEKFEVTPLVVDGVMYIVEAPNTVQALDASSGRLYWTYTHKLPEVTYPCCGRVHRGLAIWQNTLYLTTHDAKLIALDASTGRKQWEVTVADYRDGYSLTVAPLVVGDRVILGPAGGELGIQGFLAAYSAATGKLEWRFNIIPHPGEAGHETWGNDSWKYGGGSIWVTGSYDPDLNLTYWGTGNPGPDWNPSARPGDNLYTDSVIALDATTGKLKWHFQFTPHDEWDWDAAQVPVLADITFRGQIRKVILWANRNGFYYVLDRATGEFLFGKPFVKQTWAKGLDDSGRPQKLPNRGPSRTGTQTWPGVQGGTNWYAPAYSPRTNLFFLNAWEDYHSTYFTWEQEYEKGKWYAGGGVKAPVPPTSREAIVTRPPDHGYATIRALDPATARVVWEHPLRDMSESGLLTTAGGLLFSGSREGHFFALDEATGKKLWSRYLGGQVIATPITYQHEGQQYIAIAAGNSLFTFALAD
ncbi:MAG: PQQ-dependent dehydrogenase, methanol/ethanol family [Bryobacter sp.]|nr:PQQ-dependent dehydrogenase, methanol/ethanol family [Bryobacter sp.]